MTVAFRSTLAALESESRASSLWYWAGSLLLLAAWLSWLFAARVPIYASSKLGRLETAASTHRAAAETAGRVVALNVRLGDEVVEGQVLLELDATVEQRKLEQAQAQIAALDLRRAALQKQLASEQRVYDSQQAAHAAALARKRIAIDAADDQAAYRQRLQQIEQDLQREALVSQMEAIESEHAFTSSLLQGRAARAELDEQGVDNQHAQEVQLAHIAALKRELAELDAAGIAARAAVATATAEAQRHRVRAPLTGRIGSLAPLQNGDVVQPGQMIATVVPSQHVRVVADFAAADALGRIRPGQTARVVLTGFSLLEFGGLAASVTRVASEPRSGLVRVELSLRDGQATRLPVQHGLPGTVEVKLEVATPWRLLLRTIRPLMQHEAPDITVPPAQGENDG